MPRYKLSWTEVQLWEAVIEADDLDEAEWLFHEGQFDGDRCVDALFQNDLSIEEVSS